MNGVLADVIAHYVQDEPRDWDEVLPYVVFGLNSAFHHSIQETPFYLDHGRQARQPLDLLRSPERTYSDLESSYQEELSYRLKKAFQQANSALQRTRLEEKSAGGGRHTQYLPGELVLVRAPPHHRKSKWDPRYEGPFEILSQRTPVSYEVRDRHTGSTHRVHLERLRPFLQAKTRDQADEVGSEDPTTPDLPGVGLPRTDEGSVDPWVVVDTEERDIWAGDPGAWGAFHPVTAPPAGGDYYPGTDPVPECPSREDPLPASGEGPACFRELGGEVSDPNCDRGGAELQPQGPGEGHLPERPERETDFESPEGQTEDRSAGAGEHRYYFRHQRRYPASQPKRD